MKRRQGFIALLVLCSAVSCAIIPQPDPSADMYDGPAYDVNMQSQYPDPSMMTFDMDPSQEERPAYDMMAFGGNDDTESLDGDSPDARQFILRRVGITRTIIPGFGFGGLGGYGLGYGGFGGYGGYGLGGYGGGLFFDEDPESQEDNEQVDDMEHGMGSGKREKLKIAGSDIKKVIIVMKKNPQDLSSSNQVNALEAQRLGTSGFDGSTFSRRHRKGQRNTIDESEIGHNLGSSTGSNLEGQLWNKDEAMRLKRMRMMHTSSEELNVPSESNNQLWGSAEGNIDNSMMTGTSGRRVIVVPQEFLQNTRHTSSGMTSGSKKPWGSAEGNIDNSMMTGTSGRRVMVVPQEVYQNLAKKYYVPGTYNRLSKPENIDSTENMSTGFPTDSVVVKKVPHEVFEGAKVNPIDTSSIRRPNKIFKENPEMLNV